MWAEKAGWLSLQPFLLPAIWPHGPIFALRMSDKPLQTMSAPLRFTWQQRFGIARVDYLIEWGVVVTVYLCVASAWPILAIDHCVFAEFGRHACEALASQPLH